MSLGKGQASNMNTGAKTENEFPKFLGKSTSMTEVSGEASNANDTATSPGPDHVSPGADTPVTPSNSDTATTIASMNTKLDTLLSYSESLEVKISGVDKCLHTLATSVFKQIEHIEKNQIPGMLNKLEKVRNDLEEKLILYEIHERKLNLLIYGKPKSNDEDIYKVCFAVFSSLLNISMEEAMHKIPLISAHRLPRRNPSDSSSSDRHPPDPIIVRFGCMQDRDRILRASQQRPRPTPAESAEGNPIITVRTDLPPAMKRERGRLASVAYHLRKGRKDVSTRIIVNGTRVILQTRTNGSSKGPPSAWRAWKETQ